AFRKFLFSETNGMPNFFSVGFNILWSNVPKEKATRLTLHYCDLQELPQCCGRAVVRQSDFARSDLAWFNWSKRERRTLSEYFMHAEISDRLLTPVVNAAQSGDSADIEDSAQLVIVLLLLNYLFDACVNLPQFDSLILLKSVHKLLTSKKNLSKDLQSACLQLLFQLGPLYPNDVTRFLRSFENGETASTDHTNMTAVTGERLKILLEAQQHCRDQAGIEGKRGSISVFVEFLNGFFAFVTV
ncbi:hypothetical protein Tsp_13360, partial [Trichinella spiralis]|uniref:hypothetical protein n=1 Tax=Trichinella spiralis TaxID=6334 RepID=UPI0001EFE7EB